MSFMFLMIYLLDLYGMIVWNDLYFGKLWKTVLFLYK